MTTLKDIARRLATLVVAIAMMVVLVALVLPARIAYASFSVDVPFDPVAPEEPWLAQCSMPTVHQAIQSQPGEEVFPSSGIGRAEGITVETDDSPREKGASETTSEVQLVFAVFAAILPLTHFALVALISAYRNRCEEKARRTAYLRCVNMRAMRDMQHANARTPQRQTVPARTAPRTQPQMAMVFDVQPRNHQACRSAHPSVWNRQNPVRSPQRYPIRPTGALMYAR